MSVDLKKFCIAKQNPVFENLRYLLLLFTVKNLTICKKTKPFKEKNFGFKFMRFFFYES